MLQSLPKQSYCHCSWLPTITRWYDPVAEDTEHYDCRAWGYQRQKEVELTWKLVPYWLALKVLSGPQAGGAVISEFTQQWTLHALLLICSWL